MLQLRVHLFNIIGVTMPDTDNSMTAIEVKIGCTLIVPNGAAAAFNDVDVEERIYVKQVHKRFLLN